MECCGASKCSARETSIYHGKTILAPMVRVGNVGFRAYCAAQGADVVFSEEVVAAKLARCRREVRTYREDVGPMVEFVMYEPYKNKFKRTVAFATLVRTEARPSGEGAPVILQLGVAQPTLGACAALLCADDVDGVDVNMGCPKKFSVNNGMGAALMLDPPRAAAIIVAIDDAINTPDKVSLRGHRLPISIKTRLLDTAGATAQMLIAIMERVGPNRVHGITLHARTRDQAPDSPALYERAAQTVKQLRQHPLFCGVCFVLNGSVTSRYDGKRKAAHFGFDAAMIARHAMWDMSVFSNTPQEKEALHESGDSGVLVDVPGATPAACSSWLDLYRDLLRYHMRYNTPYAYAKYHLTRSVPNIIPLRHLMVQLQEEASTYENAAKIFGLPEEEQYAMRGAPPVELVTLVPEGGADLQGEHALEDTMDCVIDRVRWEDCCPPYKKHKEEKGIC
uniref:Putative tRNA-dihydrouridine synthase 2 n=1 Tax=Trypanosoma congolense (strain IL3000) TaxID=1068625 RepID=G0UW77_TRYCI|nr:putative tRNA-dihydrouridine synthase 2 [Trypanosoma congolense IL3000]